MASKDGSNSNRVLKPMSHSNDANTKNGKTAEKCSNCGSPKGDKNPDFHKSFDVFPVAKNSENGKRYNEKSKHFSKLNFGQKRRQPFSDARTRDELNQSSIPIHDQRRKNGDIHGDNKFPSKQNQQKSPNNSNLLIDSTGDSRNRNCIVINELLKLIPTIRIVHDFYTCPNPFSKSGVADDSNLFHGSLFDESRNENEIYETVNMNPDRIIEHDAYSLSNLLSNLDERDDSNIVCCTLDHSKNGYWDNKNANISLNEEYKNITNEILSLFNTKENKNCANEPQKILTELSRNVDFEQNSNERKINHLSRQSCENGKNKNEKPLQSMETIDKVTPSSNLPSEISIKTYKSKLKSVNVFVSGPPNCGKIQLIKTFAGKNVNIRKSYNCIHIYTKTYKEEGVRLKIWYASNFERCILQMKKCKLESFLLLVYSIADRQTLFTIPKYILDATCEVGYALPIMLVGNKVDLRTSITVDDDNKAEKNLNLYLDGLKVKDKFELQAFFESSGKTGKNVSSLFQYVVHKFSFLTKENKICSPFEISSGMQ